MEILYCCKTRNVAAFEAGLLPETRVMVLCTMSALYVHTQIQQWHNNCWCLGNEDNYTVGFCFSIMKGGLMISVYVSVSWFN